MSAFCETLQFEFSFLLFLKGLNAALHYQNPEEKTYISLIPTSAHTGDGMGDLMAVICRLTQTRLAKKLAFSKELESTVMEVKLTLLMPICLAFDCPVNTVI